MRDPGHSPAAALRLGELETVRAPAAQAESRSPRPAQPSGPAAAPPRALPPIRIAAAASPRAYALRDAALVLPGGLIIHNVPKGLGVRTAPAADGGELWEVVDARGRRMALLKAEAIRRGASEGTLLSRTTAARSVGERSDWGARRIKVVSDRFLGENHVYTIERRADGTAWIWSGLELASCGSRC